MKTAKTILHKIKFKFIKSKFGKISNQEKVNMLSEKAIGLFDHMKKAHSDLSSINIELNSIMENEKKNLDAENEAHQRKVKLHESNMENAQQEIQMNLKVQDELLKFVR